MRIGGKGIEGKEGGWTVVLSKSCWVEWKELGQEGDGSNEYTITIQFKIACWFSFFPRKLRRSQILSSHRIGPPSLIQPSFFDFSLGMNIVMTRIKTVKKAIVQGLGRVLGPCLDVSFFLFLFFCV